MPRPATTAQQAPPQAREPKAPPVPKWVRDGRAVVVCATGPLANRWYFADDWKSLVASAKDMVARGGQAGSIYLEYVATDRQQPHPVHAGVTGQVLRWTGRKAATR